MKSSSPNPAKTSPVLASEHEGYDNLPVEHWSLLRLQLLWIFDGPMLKSSIDYPYFPHPIAAWYLRKGSVTLSFPDGKEHYEAGQWLFPRHQQGRQHFSKDAELISLRFYAEWPSGAPLFSRKKTVIIPQQQAPALLEAAEPLASYARQYLTPADYKGVMLKGSLGAYLGVQSLIARWMDVWYQTFISLGYEPELVGPISDTVNQCLAYLRSRTLDRPFYEKELVERVGLSVSQIHRLFIKQVKVTPKEFWNNRRIEFARLALIGGNENIKSIAFNLGFQTPESFGRWFQNNVGYTPRTFRTMLH